MPLANSPNKTPPILLTSAAFYGTLAAVRCYGRNGVPVIVADHSRTGPASWSRFAGKRLLAPPQSRPQELVEWLLRFGEEQPGCVLYPTSDETAWIFAEHRQVLAKHFRLYQPSSTVIYSLLNKRKLDAIGRAEGVAFPRTWFPESQTELEQVGREARFPVLIKPVTQILHSTHSKGEVARDPSELLKKFAMMSRLTYAPEIVSFDPSVVRPIVQEFEADASRDIYSLSGFVDESGKLFGVRAATKLLQRPRRTGVGLCFESAEAKPELADAVARIARKAGYFGVFEVEFIRSGDKHLLIDFNPRFYGQMGFDIARAFPVPMLAYYAALGDRAAMSRVSAGAARPASHNHTVYCHRTELGLFLLAQRLAGGLTADEARRWRRWSKGPAVDAVIDSDDWIPVVAEAVRHLLVHARHPRVFLRTMVAKSLLLSLDLLSA